MTMTDTPVLEMIAVEDLRHTPDNLRQRLGDLDDLVASIRTLGIIEPLVIDDDNEVIAGNRRLAAAFEAGLAEVPCVRRSIADDAEAVEIMLVENLQRSGLDPIEEATGYVRLVDMGLSQHEIAERVGCNQSHVSKRIKLLELPDADQARVIDGSLKINDALASLNPDPPKPKPKPEPPVVVEEVEEVEELSDDTFAAPARDGVEVARGMELFNDADSRLWIVARNDDQYSLLGVETVLVESFDRKWQAVRAITEQPTAEREPDEPAEPEDDDTFDADEILVEADQVAELAAELGEVPECATFDAEGNLAPPWKAYTFVDDVRLIGGIREHASVDKLRWARAYETRNAGRELVLAAIDERLVELGAEL